MMKILAWAHRLDRVVLAIVLARVMVFVLANWPHALTFLSWCTTTSTWRLAARLAGVRTVTQAELMVYVLVWTISLMAGSAIVTLGYWGGRRWAASRRIF